MSENQTPLKQPTWREKLRDWKLTLQRHLVIGKHKLHKKSEASTKESVRRLRAMPVYHRIGSFLYNLGFQAEYMAVRAVRSVRYGWYHLIFYSIRAGRWLKKKAKAFGQLAWNEVLSAPVVFVRGLWRIGKNTIQVARSEGVGRALRLSCSNLWKGTRTYFRLVPRTLAYVIPAVVAVFCVGFMRQELAKNYVLSVEVKGQDVGCVSSESVFESAKDSVNERINYAGSAQTGWQITPTYSITSVEDKRELMNEAHMADAILQTSGDEIKEGTAMYIDGELRRVTTDGALLRGHLEQMKAPYETGDPSVTVGFNHEVDLQDGIYFTDSFSDIGEIMQYLTSDEVKQETYTLVAGDSISLIASKNGLRQAELYALNPWLTPESKLYPGDQMIVQKQETVLEIRVRKELTYTEEIPFATKTTKSDQYDFGTTKTLVEGANGMREITAVQTYGPTGEILETEILNTRVLQEPVTKEVVKGTRMKDGSVGKVGNGTLMWPVPNYRYVSRWAGGRHKGVDICGPIGTPIYAADSGVVVRAGMNRAGAGSNYGLSIIIDHGNGIKTLYAHASVLYVSAGQTVSQGQHIANIGMTGRTSGPHLHFEVIKNGAKIPPQTVFPGKR